MKSEKEFVWLVKILNSDYVPSFLIGRVKKSGCKRDYERLVGVSDSDKTFRKFLNVLIDEGCLEIYEEKKMVGGKYTFFIVNRNLIKKKIENHPIFSHLKNFMIKEYSEIGI